MKINLPEIFFTVTEGDIKIVRFELKEGFVVARASLKIGPFGLDGFIVLEGRYQRKGRNDRLWVSPPAWTDDIGEHHKILWFDDVRLWRFIEKMIMAEYDRLVKEKGRQKQ